MRGAPRLTAAAFTIYGNYMEKTTLYLDSADYRKLKRIAARGKRAPAALVREAVAEYVVRHGQTRAPRSVGAFSSGRGDVSERAEALLAGLGEPSRSRTPRDRR
jgi:predicted transcriptional regulator